MLLLATTLLSCSKETSIEKQSQPFTGCKVGSIVALETTTGRALYAVNTLFSVGGVPREVEAIDSVTGRPDLIQPMDIRKDSVILSDGQYFLLDANGRVRKLQIREDPTDPTSDAYVFQYSYDPSGYLIEKRVSTPALPVTLVTYNYTWTNGNLTSVEGRLTAALNPVRIFLSELEYDLNVAPKDFIYVFPDGAESFMFSMAFDYGKKSVNLLKRMTVVYYDEQGVQTDAYASDFRDVKLSPEGYVQEWLVDGDSMDPFGIFAGRVRFDYFCN
jgi:hypothetical protein